MFTDHHFPCLAAQILDISYCHNCGLWVFFSSYITFHVLRLPKTTAVLWFTKKHLIRCSRCGRWWQGYIHGRWTKSQQRSLSHLSGEGFFDRFVETKTNGCVFFKRNYTWVFPKLRLPQNGWFIIDKYRKPTTIFWKHPYIMDHVKKLKQVFLVWLDVRNIWDGNA